MLRFTCIGAQKSGTTWLYRNLSLHQDIDFPGGKEVHFWNLRRAMGIDWYRRLFEDDDKAGGDITPAYSMLEPDVVAGVAAAFPQLRLIYLIRNPVDRCWSSANMALRRAEMVPGEASDQWYVDHFNSAGSRQRSDYEQALRAWSTAFPAEQMSVVLFDQIIAAPRAVLTDCARHIGVSGDPFRAISTEILSAKVFEGHSPPIPPQLRRYLEDLYRPQIRSLAAYLGRDLPWIA